jgi:hypothetical protein
MENKGLLFIPDISGFTRFINETEIEHSRLIIQELLELLINANQSGLEISEIEGDAILFYKFGEVPPIEEIYKQVENMFCSFHRQLMAYEYRRYCQCKACISAIGLTLKVITHYGEFTGYTVKNFRKLLGRDVIIAHQLLKNDIDQHEYWLVSEKLLPGNPPQLTGWMNWNSSTKQTETGDVSFRYTQLGPLKELVEPEPPPRFEIQKKNLVISASHEYTTDMISLFHASGDFSYRHRWQEGIKAVEELTHFLPRVGMRCRYILNNGETSIYSSSYSFSPDLIEFSETSESDNSTTYYTLQNTGKGTIRLTMEYYISKNFLSGLAFRLRRKNEMENSFRKSLENLESLLKEIRIPG